jgi:hypothetical protein
MTRAEFDAREGEHLAQSCSPHGSPLRVTVQIDSVETRAQHRAMTNVIGIGIRPSFSSQIRDATIGCIQSAIVAPSTVARMGV